MTGAAETLQGAVVAALSAHPVLRDVLAGIYEGAPPLASYPYLVIGDGIISDWSTKTQMGREVQLMLTLWDDGEQPARLASLIAAVEAAVAGILRDLPGWRIASLVFLRSRTVRNPAGPWAGLIDHRVRMLEVP